MKERVRCRLRWRRLGSPVAVVQCFFFSCAKTSVLASSPSLFAVFPLSVLSSLSLFFSSLLSLYSYVFFSFFHTLFFFSLFVFLLFTPLSFFLLFPPPSGLLSSFLFFFFFLPCFQFSPLSLFLFSLFFFPSSSPLFFGQLFFPPYL